MTHKALLISSRELSRYIWYIVIILMFHNLMFIKQRITLGAPPCMYRWTSMNIFFGCVLRGPIHQCGCDLNLACMCICNISRNIWYYIVLYYIIFHYRTLYALLYIIYIWRHVGPWSTWTADLGALCTCIYIIIYIYTIHIKYILNTY